MTVEELIFKLSEYDPGLLVALSDECTVGDQIDTYQDGGVVVIY